MPVPAQVFPTPLEGVFGSLINPLVVGASGAVGLRRCFAISPPAWLESRPFAVGGDTRPLVAAGGDTRPREIDTLDDGGE